MLASLLATICSAVSCGAPSWVRTDGGCRFADFVPFASPCPAWRPPLAGPLCPALLSLAGLTVLGAAGQNAGNAGDHADDAADRASQHAADRSGGLVAFARALLNALHQPLRVRQRGAPKSNATAIPRTAHHLAPRTRLNVGLFIVRSPQSILRLSARCSPPRSAAPPIRILSFSLQAVHLRRVPVRLATVRQPSSPAAQSHTPPHVRNCDVCDAIFTPVAVNCLYLEGNGFRAA